MRSFSTLFLALSLPFYVLAGHVDSRAHRHAEVALRARGHVLQKRFSGPFTYYDITVGPVACNGQHFPASAFVVAMNSADFGGGSACGKQISITVNGKTVGASVVDLCPGCGPHGLDLTSGVFQAFADLGVGVLHGDWVFGGGGGGPPPPPPPPTTTHTTTHSDPPHRHQQLPTQPLHHNSVPVPPPLLPLRSQPARPPVQPPLPPLRLHPLSMSQVVMVTISMVLANRMEPSHLMGRTPRTFMNCTSSSLVSVVPLVTIFPSWPSDRRTRHGRLLYPRYHPTLLYFVDYMVF
ncbi:RlpA-like double-psi beta-barrel-protein domain-containing protein-containing protein [Russula brevipes]|nr:RlpA-like double-psi beta-barrel-protein domain-containing protein-containing protein [Russula brevipes]